MFQTIQTITNSVMYIRNFAVPMKRANCSAKEPNASAS